MGKIGLLIGVAAAVAVALASIAHNQFGLSPTLVRDVALLGSGMLGIGLFSTRVGGRD